ncbi:hypothetical protein ACIA7S_42140 [Streptomyces sp. NPDC051643]
MTVAVRTLASPKAEGSGAEVSVVVVFAALTVWVSMGEVDPLWLVLPL